ncbi:glycosyl hydrolase catalytic core-domain-containing protein [Mycena maculata]|uniref:Glycosyl hydrolase catalytic core-domain-containing protein n=1 Tax=Mycena maculata TaxID=230809 RepID=A0AAD7NZS4_9AGAR|nr:glycosyl hydrolase catalytic core-domain-containing protein [Mycena maculata]
MPPATRRSRDDLGVPEIAHRRQTCTWIHTRCHLFLILTNLTISRGSNSLGAENLKGFHSLPLSSECSVGCPSFFRSRSFCLPPLPIPPLLRPLPLPAPLPLPRPLPLPPAPLSLPRPPLLLAPPPLPTPPVVSWVYNWGLVPPDYLADSGIEFIPMQWGAADIETLAVTVKGLGATTLLAFNEPDAPVSQGQSNINATYAAQLWMQYIEPLSASGVRLGAPAISSGATGMPWLTAFMAACSQCTIDFIPFHWYGDGTGGFYDYLYALNGQFNKTVWVTEFAETSDNDTVVLDFMNTTITALDGLDFVERYAWFGYFRPTDGSHYNLLDVNGDLNACGQVYVDAAKTVVNALPNPTGSGTPPDGGPTNSAGGYTTVYPASDTGLTPAFATQTGNSGQRAGGAVGGTLFGLGTVILAAAFGVGLVW